LEGIVCGFDIGLKCTEGDCSIDGLLFGFNVGLKSTELNARVESNILLLNIGGKGKFGEFSFNRIISGLYVRLKSTICDLSLEKSIGCLHEGHVWQGINRGLECLLGVVQLALHARQSPLSNVQSYIDSIEFFLMRGTGAQ